MFWSCFPGCLWPWWTDFMKDEMLWLKYFTRCEVDDNQIVWGRRKKRETEDFWLRWVTSGVMGHVLELYGRLRLCSDVVISWWQRGQQWFATVNVLSWASDIMHEASSGAGRTAYPNRLFVPQQTPSVEIGSCRPGQWKFLCAVCCKSMKLCGSPGS